MTTKPVTDAELSAAMRMVYGTGSKAKDPIHQSVMLSALEQFAQSRAAEAVGAVPVTQQFYCNKCGYVGSTQMHPPCDYLAVPVTAPPSTAPKAQDDLAGAETEHGIAHSLAGFRGGFMSEHGRWPTEQEIWNHAIRSWRDLNPSQPKAPAPVLVAQGEAGLGLEPPKLNYTLLHAFASTHRIGYNDLCTVVRDAIIATPPGGAGGDVGAACHSKSGKSETQTSLSATGESRAEQVEANPGLGSGASGGVPTDAERYRFWRDCWGREQFLPTLSRTVASLSKPLTKGDYNNFDIVSDAAILSSTVGRVE